MNSEGTVDGTIGTLEYSRWDNRNTEGTVDGTIGTLGGTVDGTI